MMARLWSVAVAVCLAVGSAPWVAAQPRLDSPHRTVTDGFPGVRIFVPERWGIVGVTLANPSDRAADVLSAHYFSTDPGLQFARRLWVPARARRTSWYPVLPPKGSNRGVTLEVKSLLVDRSGEREVLLRDTAAGALTNDGLLPSQRGNQAVTGLIDDADDDQGWLLPQAALIALGRSPRLAQLRDLPPTAESLQGLDHLVLGSERPASDPASLGAIRHWLRGGGRLWVRLDRVSPATVSLLLGEDFPCTVVDRVDLTRWQFQNERLEVDPDDPAFDLPAGVVAPRTAASSTGMIQVFESPVEMVRVVIPGVRPVHAIDGWPVSFWRRSGRGLVLFTTLGPRGWLNPRGPGDKARRDAQSPIGEFKESEALHELAAAFLKPREGPPLRPQAFAPLLAGQVGYRVVGRGIVLAVLGAFCLGLMAAGWWLRLRGDLAHLGWIGPAAALTATLLFIVLGQQGVVPATAAMGQLVEFAPGAEDAAVTGLLALYNPGGPFEPLGAERGGLFLPDRKVQGASTRRLVWTDLDRWHWENLALPPGLHQAPFAAAVRTGTPLSARVTFGPEGALGKVALGPFQAPSDALLALPSRRNLAVRFADGAFTAGSGDQLPPGKFLTSALLSDEQGRRQEIYRQLLEQRTWQRYPLVPMVFAWARPLDLGIIVPEGTRRAGSALVAIPLEFVRPAPGTALTIPAAFVTYRCLIGPGLALLYDPNLNEWVSSRTRSSRTVLRFQVPAELLPLRVERAVLDVDVNAPQRSFEIFAGPGATGAALAARSNLVGRARLVLDRPDLLQPDASGGIYLGLAVGEAGQTEWKISDVQLELSGGIPED